MVTEVGIRWLPGSYFQLAKKYLLSEFAWYRWQEVLLEVELSIGLAFGLRAAKNGVSL